MPGRPSTLADGLEQYDAGGDRYVEASDVAAHRDATPSVAPLPHQAPQAQRLRRPGRSRSAGEVDRVVASSSLRRRGHGPDPQLLQFLERARDVDDLGDLHVRDRAGRGLRGRRIERGGPARSARRRRRRPAASAVRRIAPRLCGSSMPSSTTSSGAAARAAHQDPRRCSRSAHRHRRRRPDARPPRLAIEQRRVTRSTEHAAFAANASSSRIGPSSPHAAQRLHAAGAQRLEDRVDAVDDHPGATPCRWPHHAPDARRSKRHGSRRASSAAGESLETHESSSAAPRSIAGTARSSSSPSASPVRPGGSDGTAPSPSARSSRRTRVAAARNASRSSSGAWPPARRRALDDSARAVGSSRSARMSPAPARAE